MARPRSALAAKRVGYSALGPLRGKIAKVGRLAVARATGFTYGTLCNKLNGFNHLYSFEVEKIERAIAKIEARRKVEPKECGEGADCE